MRQAIFIAYISHSNRFLKDLIEAKIKGKIKLTVKRGRKRNQLVDTLRTRRNTGA